jgi:hypothetical protein
MSIYIELMKFFLQKSKTKFILKINENFGFRVTLNKKYSIEYVFIELVYKDHLSF